jgi:hypothetical protein
VSESSNDASGPSECGFVVFTKSKWIRRGEHPSGIPGCIHPDDPLAEPSACDCEPGNIANQANQGDEYRLPPTSGRRGTRTPDFLLVRQAL